MKLSVFVSALLFSLNLFAANWAEDFEALKSVPRSYEDSGAICEEVARLDVRKQFPAPQYHVEVGIAYGDGHRTIGELDIIVFDLNMQRVVRIGEVKCWKSFSGGLNKARDQRGRFLKTIRSNGQVFFKNTSTGQMYDQAWFEGINDFISIGQAGAVANGYDQELGYTLNELHQHTGDMLRCQKQGECAKP
ncbi:hypothetical protein [Bdellovibrio sp. KM01]|uniref:hypothetical protein n=1 Tax=Bdellovibrio sp. KM01 TaxID=2748865 RepID=UPI0015EAA23A|nr:hypothetical protein [Bdellovibrio sp. KM01]QLY26238.1 hypothetical protein HW988_04195 [Bdellovibrio sp. KM01]